MKLKAYTYSVVRFVPDPVRGERINLGIIAVSDQEGESRCQFLSGHRRKIMALDPSANVQRIEQAIEDFKQHCGASYSPTIFREQDPRLTSTRQLKSLAQTMKNQFQLSEPGVYRAESFDKAVNQLFERFVAPPQPDRAAQTAKTMPLSQLRELIERTIRDWNEHGIAVRESSSERVEWARHYADFWLVSGQPEAHLAALIAVPDNPDEPHEAWALRDSVPTITEAFRRFHPGFKTVVVFPPDGSKESGFVDETKVFLNDSPGVIVTHVGELPALRDELTPMLATSRWPRPLDAGITRWLSAAFAVVSATRTADGATPHADPEAARFNEFG